MTRQNSYILCIITWKRKFSHDTPKSCKFVALLRFEAGLLMTRQKLLHLMHYNVEKQVFSWGAKKCKFVALLRRKAGFLMTSQNSYIWCIIWWKCKFSHDKPKRCKFVALLRIEASFLITRQKSANLLPYYLEKQVFSWRAKKVQICCIITFRSRFSHDTPKTLIIEVLLRGKAGFLMTSQKSCKFVAILRFEASFLMTHQKLLYLMHYYVEKQIFSWRAKKVQICCIITFRSRFSHHATVNKVYIWCIITFRSRFPHDASKTLIFDALLRGKAGFLMTPQKVQICCLITWKSRFSHNAPKTLIFHILLRGKAGFLMTRQKGANLLH